MKIKDYGMHIRTDINENAKAAFKAISMKIPNKVLYDEFNEKQKTVALRRK
ncbi:MAG: hypothetical protein JXA66_08415 [Oligoflexia bacterium]|nr:hypothetical protein [Oligoflexia bacterium]